MYYKEQLAKKLKEKKGIKRNTFSFYLCGAAFFVDLIKQLSYPI